MTFSKEGRSLIKNILNEGEAESRAVFYKVLVENIALYNHVIFYKVEEK